jgi:calcium-dependent protein kinase
MQNELAILEDTTHPSIMNIYELLHDDKFYFIVSEYVRGGELYDYIVSNNSISEELVRKIVQQLYLALNYMH